MHVIGFVAQKGGGGKTTLASSLAVHAVSRKSTVGLLDMDPQQSLAEWYERRGQPKNPQLYTGVDTASEAIELLGAEGLDYLFIDTGPGLLHAIEPVIAVSDLIVVPVKASAFDLMAIAPTLEVARESRQAVPRGAQRKHLIEDGEHCKRAPGQRRTSRRQDDHQATCSVPLCCNYGPHRTRARR